MKTTFTASLLILLLLSLSQAQTVSSQRPFRLQPLDQPVVLLDKGWTFHAGDNPAWASPAYSDQDWPAIDPTQDVLDLPTLWQSNRGWFRLRFSLDSALRNEPLALLVEQTGASEIFLNGHLIARFGHLSNQPGQVRAVNPLFGEWIPFPLQGTGEQVLAVRFALQKGIPYVQPVGTPNPALLLRILKLREVGHFIRSDYAGLSATNPNISGLTISIVYFKAGLFFILSLLHLSLYGFYPVRKANLYFFFFAFLHGSNYFFSPWISHQVPWVATLMYWNVFIFLSYLLSFWFLLLAIYSIFGQRRGLNFRILAGCFLLSLLLFGWSYHWGWNLGAIVFPIPVFLESARISILAQRSKQRGARIITLGAFGFLVFTLLFYAIFFGFLPAGPDSVFIHLTYNLGLLSLPVAISVYLALESSFANRSLAARLMEVQQLSEANLAQQREKQQWQELDSLKSRFFANVSHEFRTPLSLIRGTVEKLQRQEETAHERQTDYQLIDRNASRLLQMINQLLDLSRLEAGKLELHPQPGELTGFLKLMAGSFASLFESKGITYRYTVSLQPVWVMMDREKLEQILANLLSNAYKFTPHKGEVRLSASVETPESDTCNLQLIVQDTGIGIADEALPCIFDRFYQVDNSATRSYEGTGIGLALVKELVELHAGRIQVESTPGSGTTFRLHLPLVTTQEMEQSEPEIPFQSPLVAAGLTTEESGAEAAASKRAGSVPHLLIVEDNADLRHFIASQLSKNYSVSEVENGLEGYHTALETVPDLIISDVMMPGMDGMTLCEKLKTDERTSHIPIILLTAKADAASKLEGLETGADDYLTKPFQVEELQVRVKNLMEGRKKLRERFSRQIILQPAEVAVTSTDERFLQKALAIMEAHMADAEFDVETFSREIGMSRTQLHRKLTALINQSANEFIRTMRMKRAAPLLEQYRGNVSEVAFLVGFSSPNYFTKCFRDFYGTSPSEYTLSAQGNGNKL